MAGVAVGILTMRFAAGIFSRLIEKIPALGPAAYLLVFNIGVEFILKRLGVDPSEAVRFGLNVGVLAAAVVYSRWPWLQRALALPFRAFRWVFYALDWLIGRILMPVGWVFAKLADYFSLSPRRLSIPQSGSD